REAFQAYDAATNTYLKCDDAAMESARKSAGSAPEGDLETLKTFGTSAHNTAIDQEQAVADQLNTLVRAYNAKHPPGSRALATRAPAPARPRLRLIVSGGPR